MTARLQRIVVVETAAHMLAAAEYSGRPDFFVMTAPAAAGYAGPRHLKALCAMAPALPAIIDCGDDPGLALRALDLGWRYLLCCGAEFPKIQSAAAKLGATVFQESDIGARLMLSPDRDPEPALGRFLGGERP